MSTTADNFFSCSETPANFPSGLKLADIVGSSTSILRIISQIPGPGNYTGPHDFFFDINENPTTSIQFNGFMYNLSHSYLCMPGVHKISREAKVCDAELVILFNPSQTTASQQTPILLCIPVESGIRINPQSKKYFATLTTGVTANRPTLGSILQPNSTFITYNGFNFMLRVGDSNTLKSCSDIPVSPTNKVRYLVCQNAIGMTTEDYLRFNGQLARKPRPVGANDYAPLEQLVKPPVCLNEISKDRFVQLTTRITNVVIEAGDALAASCNVKRTGIATSALKCKPIRTKGDGGLSIDMTKGGTTLDKELSNTQDALDNMDLGEMDPGISATGTTSQFEPGDIERGIGIVLGILFGVVMCALVGYLIQRFLFGDRYVQTIVAKETATMKLPSIPSLPKIRLPDITKFTCPKE